MTLFHNYETLSQIKCDLSPKRLVEEGGIEILLTLLLSGTGNLENNPRPVKESSVRMRQLCLEVDLPDLNLERDGSCLRCCANSVC